MIYQKCYHLSILEEKEYVRAELTSCKDRSNKYIFEWDKKSTQNKFQKKKQEIEELKKFLKNELNVDKCYVYDHQSMIRMKIDFFDYDEGSYLIFEKIEWEQFLRNWAELRGIYVPKISPTEIKELKFLWEMHFPAFELFKYCSYHKWDAFGHVLHRYI